MHGQFHSAQTIADLPEIQGLSRHIVIPCPYSNTASPSGSSRNAESPARIQPGPEGVRHGVGLIVRRPRKRSSRSATTAGTRRRQSPVEVVDHRSPPSSAQSRVERAHLRIERRRSPRSHVGRIGDEHIEGAATSSSAIGREPSGARFHAERSRVRGALPRSAAGLMSVPTPVAWGSSDSSVSSRQPTPVPTSRMRSGRSPRQPATRCETMPLDDSVSLSGRGSSVAGG